MFFIECIVIFLDVIKKHVSFFWMWKIITKSCKTGQPFNLHMQPKEFPYQHGYISIIGRGLVISELYFRAEMSTRAYFSHIIITACVQT